MVFEDVVFDNNSSKNILKHHVLELQNCAQATCLGRKPRRVKTEAERRISGDASFVSQLRLAPELPRLSM